ncbi:uncharacterized protein LTHEOB_5120 [Lasiodiplodia theobromae]|uniref:uncharacterized protein n=1 Tax=Lasiodiplodia theobromae TaxID=45133 RepID=UPI0015C36B32|nr:uncharacterized protein LTHEOB_5120 [Lasiodiplodia theobromae]KAF4545287.1 hypothetical protein LTHEOB_5120 [Lasiodiplodia theobromae]
MHFYAVAIIAVACAAPVMGNSETTIRAFGDVDKGSLKYCLSVYRSNNWDGGDCGGRGWFKGHLSTYHSPENCYDACSQGIRSAIDQGASDVICHDYEGLTNCWMGYH